MKILAPWLLALTATLVLGSLLWPDFWFTPVQQGQQLMDEEQFQAAAEVFEDPIRQGVAWYRAGEFKQAEQAFASRDTPEAHFNRGNCLVMQGKYDKAIEQYEIALDSRPGWRDAAINRDIATARGALLNTKGGHMGDQKIGADEIVFDGKKQPAGQDTEVSSEDVMNDATMQALWLKRVQTQPADFLRARFAYQNSMQTSATAPPQDADNRN